MTNPGRTPHKAVVCLLGGSGIKDLVCAAVLGRGGKSVRVVQRNPQSGGCIRAQKLIAPGFVDDVMAAIFLLFEFSPFHPQFADDLEIHRTGPIGVSIHPGAGLGGGSGFLLANGLR